MKRFSLFSLMIAAGLFATSMVLAAGQWDNAKVRTAVEKYVAAKPLEIQDPKTNQRLKLSLKNVSNEITPMGQNAIVKADCVDTTGKSYDVDFTVDSQYKVVNHKLRNEKMPTTDTQ